MITNIKVASAKKEKCYGFDSLYEFTHKCDKVFPCVLLHHSVLRIRPSIVVRHRRFLSDKCVQNHVTLKVKVNLICHWRQVSRNCSYLVTVESKH